MQGKGGKSVLGQGCHMSKGPEVEKLASMCSLRNLGVAERRYMGEVTSKIENVFFSQIMDSLDYLAEKSVHHSGSHGKPGMIFQYQLSYLSPVSHIRVLSMHRALTKHLMSE